jgi:hypothetical protein
VGEEEERRPEEAVGAPSQKVVEVEEAGFQQIRNSGIEHLGQEEAQQQPRGRHSQEHHIQEHRSQ